MNNIAPDIFRKRLLIEGYYTVEVTGETIKKFFRDIITELSLKTYGEPIVHATSGIGKESNQGYDAFIPLIDSGIYIGVWVNRKFLSLIIYTCKDFSEDEAIEKTKGFFRLSQYEQKLF
jgi:S-adenosylmethionine decarboxylase